MSENALLGTLPAELGELTDLERLCGRLPTLGLGAQRCPGTLGIVARIAVVLCLQPPSFKRVQRHHRELDRQHGEAHLLVLWVLWDVLDLERLVKCVGCCSVQIH